MVLDTYQEYYINNLKEVESIIKSFAVNAAKFDYKSTMDKTEEELILQTKSLYQSQLDKNGLNKITTEIKKAGPFYYAEHYHQQYLAKNPDGYCSLVGTGIRIK